DVADDDDDLENVDERELLENDVDNQDPGQNDERNDSNNDNEDKLEDDDMENIMNDKLDENDDQSDDNVDDESQTEMTEKNDEEMQENLQDETNDAAAVDELNKNDDEVLKGGAGGMERGAVEEDTMEKDEISNSNVMDEKEENMKENDSTTEMKNEGRNGCGKSEDDDDDIRNERQENAKNDDKKLEKEKKLADDITDITMQEILPSEGEQKDEEGPEFGHINENNNNLREQIVIDKSSVEEARNSKGNRDQLKDLKNINAEVDEKMMEDDNSEDKQEVNENDIDIWNSNFQNSIIHSTTDFYHLVEQSVSTTNTSLDAEEVVSSSADAEERWNRISDSISVLAAELSENLRMIIEPTVASRFE
ncbi:unnamed protein product, partial [Onchocerca flexuosa]|uniref:Midasin n=1 Tax=Onchocerca flexuosa TaxID=387005 RepID=A0A183HFW5_9BILA